MYVFCNHSARFFSPSSHAALPQFVLSLINPVSSMALINRTLFTSYTWPARNSLLWASPPFLFLFFPLSFSIFFFFSFRHLIFSSSQSFYTSGFHTSDFSLWMWLVKESSWTTLKLHLWKDPPFRIYSFILQGQLQLLMVLQHVWTWCFSHWLLVQWTWLKSQNICVCSLLQPTCPRLYVSVFCSRRSMRVRMFCVNVTVPLHTMYVITFIITTHFIQPGFDILWSSNTDVLCGNSCRDSP